MPSLASSTAVSAGKTGISSKGSEECGGHGCCYWETENSRQAVSPSNRTCSGKLTLKVLLTSVVQKFAVCLAKMMRLGNIVNDYATTLYISVLSAPQL